MQTEKELTLQIVADNHGSNNPREWDNLGTMVCSHRRYNLGDEDGFSQAVDLLRSNLSDKVLDEYDLSDPVEVYRLLSKSDLAIILPLYLYDHSGITMKTTPFSCPWDSGQVGYIFVSKEDVRQEYGWKRLTQARIKKVESYLTGEVEVYDQWLTGDVWGFRAYEDGEEVDSCWGFFGYNPKENGMFDHLSEPFQALVEAGNYERRYD